MSPLSATRLCILAGARECVHVCARVCMRAVFDEVALPHRVDILTEKGKGQSGELCKESDVSVTSIMSHTDG